VSIDYELDEGNLVGRLRGIRGDTRTGFPLHTLSERTAEQNEVGLLRKNEKKRRKVISNLGDPEKMITLIFDEVGSNDCFRALRRLGLNESADELVGTDGRVGRTKETWPKKPAIAWNVELIEVPSSNRENGEGVDDCEEVEGT
jgi:hypothetical protein